MPKTALIIEDDEGVGKALQALCEKLGLEASINKNGKEGLEQATANKPDLVVLDLLLPGIDGFKVAEGFKAADFKPALVVVSGVYKDPKVGKEFADKYGGEFFQKPFKVDDLTRYINRTLGLVVPEKPAPVQKRVISEAPAVQPPMEGSLRDKPFPLLLLELSRGKATGILDLTQGQVKKRVFLYCGQVRFAQSNVKGENVGGMQVAEGAITEDQFREAVGRAKKERMGIGEALAVSGAMTYDALAKANRRQVEEVCVTAHAWNEGSFKYVPGSTDKIQDMRHDPTALILNGFKRYATPELVKAQLTPLAKGSISRHPDFDRALFTMRSVFPGETLTPMINGRLNVGDVLAKARPEDLPLFSAIVTLNLCVLVGVELPKRLAVPVAGPAHEHTAEEEGAREQILPEYERVQAAKDLFAVLRLPRGAPVDECKASYLALAKRFHADSFAGLDLGDATDKLRDVFAKISEAHSILTDAKRRNDYEILLERQDAGLPTDVEVIFKAEAAFSRGDALSKQGRFSDAEAAFKEALKLDTSVAQYYVGLAHAILKGRGAAGAAEAREVLDKSLALNPEHVAAMLMKAHALELEGDPTAALKLLTDVLAIDPSSAEAGGQYKALRDWMKKGGEGKGLLGKLFGRK